MAVIGGGWSGETAELLARTGAVVLTLKDMAVTSGPPCGLYCERLMNNPRIKIITARGQGDGENSVVFVREEGRQAIQGIDTVVLAAEQCQDEIVEEIKHRDPVHDR